MLRATLARFSPMIGSIWMLAIRIRLALWRQACKKEAMVPVQPVVSDEKLPHSVDVVGIGGGIAGVTAAYALAKKALSVALIEKGVTAGEQSSRNWGWCRQQHRDLRELPLAMKSLEIWGNLNPDVEGETGFRRTGLLSVTTRPADFAEWEAWTPKPRDPQIHTRLP